MRTLANFRSIADFSANYNFKADQTTLWSNPNEQKLSITKNGLQKYDRSLEILEWKSAFKTSNLGVKKKHVTREEITCMISLTITRAWLQPGKNLRKPPCWPLLRRPSLNTGPYWHYFANIYGQALIDR